MCELPDHCKIVLSSKGQSIDYVLAAPYLHSMQCLERETIVQIHGKSILLEGLTFVGKKALLESKLQIMAFMVLHPSLGYFNSIVCTFYSVG